MVINDVNDGTFFARLLLRMENELGRKIVELDARPSDSIVLALQGKRPILVARKVFDSVDDMSEILERVLKQQSQEEQENDEEEEEEESFDEAAEDDGGDEDENEGDEPKDDSK